MKLFLRVSMKKIFIALSILLLVNYSKIAGKEQNKNIKKQDYHSLSVYKKAQVIHNKITIQKAENGEIAYESPRRKGGNYDIFPYISVIKTSLKD